MKNFDLTAFFRINCNSFGQSKIGNNCMQNRYEKTELPGCAPFSKKLWFAIPNISCSKRKSFFLSVVLNQPYMVIHVPELWKIFLQIFPLHF